MYVPTAMDESTTLAELGGHNADVHPETIEDRSRPCRLMSRDDNVRLMAMTWAPSYLACPAGVVGRYAGLERDRASFGAGASGA